MADNVEYECRTCGKKSSTPFEWKGMRRFGYYSHNWCSDECCGVWLDAREVINYTKDQASHGRR